MATFYHESVPNASGIYRITCITTGKFYIGSAVNLRLRRKEHFGTLQRNTHKNPKLQRAWNKYGSDNFTFDILELVLIPEMLTAREQHWFGKLKPFGDRGFNIAKTAGSNLGVKCSPEKAKKIGDTQRGRPRPHVGVPRSAETRKKLSIAGKGRPSPNKGKSPSAEVRAKLSAAAKLQSHDPEIFAASMKRIIAISPNGIEYDVVGIRRFCREHNLLHTKMMQVAQGKYSQHRGWKARFPDGNAA